MFDPAFGFAGFEFEFGDGFDGVNGREDFGVGGMEFVGDVCGASQGAAGVFVESRGEGGESSGQEVVVLDVEIGNGEAGFQICEGT